MPDSQAQPAPRPFGAMLLFWLGAFLVWQAIASRCTDLPPAMVQWYGGVLCALTTVCCFGWLASQTPPGAHLIVWGIGGALLTLAGVLAPPGAPFQPLLLSLGMLAATFAAGALLGETVDSAEYGAPIFFAAVVDAGWRAWGQAATFAADARAGSCALCFPVPLSGQLRSFVLPSELLFLAVCLRAVERLGSGPSRSTAAAAAAVFCLSSGTAQLALLRCPLMTAAFMIVQWLSGRQLVTASTEDGESDSHCGPFAFGLALSGLMLLLTWASGPP